MDKTAISVLTPTYNRAHVLHRAYESLRRQKGREFEWLVVDDGSTDETPTLLARWQSEADFPKTWCRYSNNRGKNSAINIGKTLIQGDSTMILDSDDALLDDALETIAYWRQKTRIDQLGNVYQMEFRRLNDTGDIMGTLPSEKCELPEIIMEFPSNEMRYVFGAIFDFSGVSKTEIFRKYDYIELTDAEHCPEICTHTKLANLYRSIFVDRRINIYLTSDGEQRLTDKNKINIKWPRGGYIRALTILNNDIDYLRCDPNVFLNTARKISRLGLHIDRSPLSQYGDLTNVCTKAPWTLAFPGGVAGYVCDRLRKRRAPPADCDIASWGPALSLENWELHLAECYAERGREPDVAAKERMS